MGIKFHKSVLLQEVIKGLNIKPGKKYIDATLGGGGHSLEILKRGGVVLGIDWDEEAIKEVKKILSEKDIKILSEKEDKALNIFISQYPNIFLVQGNFKDIKKIAEDNGFEKVAGVLFDLGVSSHQLEDESRGFSFKSDAPLDMRMDQTQSTTAADILNTWPKEALYEIFKEIGQEQYSGRIVDAIFGSRPVKTCRKLADICMASYPPSQRYGKLHPGTKVFMALRIVTNQEFENLREALPQALELLEKEGRLVVISFHSGEDRIVKNFIRDETKNGLLQILTKKPIIPTEAEVTQNPRARSAKLRIGEKI